jgi:hypothetical protein
MKCLEWSPKPDADSSQRANLLLAHPSGISVTEPWYLLSNLDPTLNLVWTYGRSFYCEQLFSSQKSKIFQLESSYMLDPARINLLLLLLLAIAKMRCSLKQGYTVSLACESCRVDPHWQRGMSFVRIGLKWLQQYVANTFVSRQRKLSKRFASLSVTFNWCRDRIGHFLCLRPLSG